VNILEFLVICVIVCYGYTYDVPLAVWSGTDYLKGSNRVSQYITPGETEQLIRSFVNRGPFSGILSDYVNFDSNHQPEVIVLFIEAQLRSEQLSTYASSLTSFKNILKNSPSSLQVPFVDMSSAFDGHVIQIVKSINEATGKVYYFGKGSHLLQDILQLNPNTVIGLKPDFENTIKKNSKIFTNGVTDLILVYFSAHHESPDKFAETDSVITNVHTLISSHTSDYVSVYTALAYDNPEFNYEFGGDKRKTVAKRFILQSHNGTSNNSNQSVPSIFRQYFGGWFWELFICLLIMIPLLVIGTYGIDSIQTPIFESKKKTN